MKKLFSLVASIALVAGMFPAINVSAATYSAEMETAYDYAYGMGITTMSSIDNANMYGTLTRIALAKMVSNYVLELGLQTPDTSKDCSFNDVSSALDAQYADGVTNACQLGLMGVGIDSFRPYDEVTRAEFGTVLSRAMWGDTNNGATPYYVDHLNALQDAGVMTNISNPSMKEVRGYVMLMMQRADENGVATNTPAICSTPENVLACSLGLDSCPAECMDNDEEDEYVMERDGTLEVELSSGTPNSVDLPKGAEGVEVAEFTVNADNADIDLMSVVLKRVGLGAENAVSDVALFSDNGRVTSAKSFSSSNNEVTLTFSPMLTVKRGQSMKLRALVTTSTTTYAKFAVSMEDITTSAEDVDANFPIVAEEMTIGSATAASVAIDDNGSAANVKVGEKDVEVFKFKLTNNSTEQEDVVLNSITLKENGTVDEEDELSDFKLLYNNDVVASASRSNGKYVTFDLDDEVLIEDGKTEKFSVTADIDGGAGKTIQFYVDKDLDVQIEGNKYGYVSIDATAITSTTTSTAININAGELVLEDVDPSTDKIKEDKNNIVLGKLKVTNVAGKSLELQKFGVLATLTAGTAFVDDGAGGGTANDGIQNGTEAAVTLDTILENFELYNASNGGIYELTRDTNNVYVDSDLTIALNQGTTTFEFRADTKKQIVNFDTVAIDFSLVAGDVTAGGAFYVIETEDDTLVNDITPSSLTWKQVKGTEASGTLSLTPLANVSKVRGAEGVVALQFNVKADESSDLMMDEVKVDVQANGAAATNQEIAQVALYKGSVSEDNLLDRISGSNLAAGIATFNGFNTEIAAEETQAYVVTVSIVDGADSVTNSPITVDLTSISLEDEDNDTVTASPASLLHNRAITVTNAGSLAVTEDVNNEDNKDPKTILAGTSMNVYSVDVQATNEDVSVEQVVFTTTSDLTSAVTNASLYLGDELIATNTNADITATTITFDNLSNLVIPQDTVELILKLNTATIGYEKVGEVVVAAAGDITDVDLNTLEGVDSGKSIANVSTAVTSSAAFSIVPVKAIPSVTTALSSSVSQAKLTVTIDKGANTVDASNAAPTILITDLVFSEVGNNVDGYIIYKEGQSSRQGTISAAGAFAAGTMSAADLTISSSTTYVIVPGGTANATYSPNLTKDGVVYTVNGVAGAAGLTSNTLTELELGSRTY